MHSEKIPKNADNFFNVKQKQKLCIQIRIIKMCRWKSQSGQRICGMAFYTGGYHFNPFFDESYVINEDRLLLPVLDCDRRNWYGKV